MIHRFRCKQSLRLKYAMIKLKPGFQMIATIAVIAATAKKKKKNFSDGSDHMKPLSSDRSDNNHWDIKSYISAIVVAAIAGEWFPYDR